MTPACDTLYGVLNAGVALLLFADLEGEFSERFPASVSF